MKRILLFLTYIFIFNSFSFAQKHSELDSLMQIISISKQDTVKIKTYLQIAEYYKNKLPDSALLYQNKILAIADYDRDKRILAKSYNDIGIIYQNYGNFQLSLDYYFKSKKIYEEIGDNSGLGGNYVNIGLIYYYKGTYDKALEFYHKGIALSEKENNSRLKSVCLENIGLLYFEQREFDDAKKYFYKSLTIDLKSGNKHGVANTYLSLGNLFGEMGNIDSALVFFQKALKVNVEIDDQYGIGYSQGNIGVVLEERKNYDQALAYYEKTVAIYRSIEYLYGEAMFLNHISSVYLLKKDYKKAISFAQKAKELSKDIGALEAEKSSYRLISSAYKELRDYKKALEYRNKWVNINDSIFSKDKAESIAEMNTKYETAKKEKQIVQQQAEIKTSKLEAEKEKAEKEKQKTQRNMFIVAFGLMIILAAFVFRSYKQKKKANAILAKQKEQIAVANEELNQQNEEITSQRDEIEAQRDTVVMQKNQLEKINHEISESIDYATRLQGAVLPDEAVLKKYLSDYFVLYKPKDKVSGDFYWWTHIENRTVITAADCTGHGVPGAFMSMLGASFLREIVEKEYVTHTGVILRKLRKEIVKALKQKGESSEPKDGMDMAIISIDYDTNIVQFSGANNPLYIVANKPIEGYSPLQGLENFYEIKADKMPIAIYEKMNRFSTHEIQLSKGDILYMFSDGFVDQFGGANNAIREAGGKKFKSKPFKRLLSEIRNKSMLEQKEILNTTFENWKSDLDQIDDVVVLGIKL